jgi:uncharacterized repeat protein (TIGR02543 family)
MTTHHGKIRCAALAMISLALLVGCSDIFGDYKNSYDPKAIFVISFDGNGGTGTMSSQSFTKGSTVVLSGSSFYREGYEFMGWTDASGSSTVGYTAGMSYVFPARDLTLYAVWAKGVLTRTLSADETWENSSPLATRIVVPSGITLTIKAGTTVSLAAASEYYKKLFIIVSSGGKLVAEGSASSPIIFRSDATTPTADDWQNITVAEGGMLTLKYCVIRDAGTALYLNKGATSDISNACFKNCGTGLYTGCSALSVSNCSFDACGSALNLYSDEAATVLSKCAFMNCGWAAVSLNADKSTISITDSNFTGNGNNLIISGKYDSTGQVARTNAVVSLSGCYPESPSTVYSGNSTDASYFPGCAFNISGGSGTEVAGAGCGFDYSSY